MKENKNQENKTSFFKSMFSSKSGSVSSKRVFGGLGFIVCIAIAIVAVAMNKDVPSYCSEVLYVCAGLLGVDSVVKAFQGVRSGNNNTNTNKDNQEENYE